MKADQRSRRAIDAYLSRPMNDAEWVGLIEENFVGSTDDMTPEEIAGWLSRWRERTEASAQRATDAPEMAGATPRGPERQAALSSAMAHLARKDSRVVRFRAEHLQGRALPYEEVGEWVERQAALDGPATHWATLPLAPGYRIDTAALAAPKGTQYTVVATAGPLEVGDRLLAYGVAGSTYSQSKETAAGGVLDALRQLSQHLARRYGWTEPQATVFVLTDLVPVVRPISARVTQPRPLTATSRITLTIDPALSPREVANYYSETRSRFAGARHRGMSDKHLALAVFTASRPAGEKWEQRMAVWNVEHPEWHYGRVTNFGRDGSAALRRLLYPSYR